MVTKKRNPEYRILRSFNARIGDRNVFITRANAHLVEEMDSKKRQEFIKSGSLEEVNPAPVPAPVSE